MERLLDKYQRREIVKERKKNERDTWDALSETEKREYCKTQIVDYCKIFIPEEKIIQLKEFEKYMSKSHTRKINKEALLRKFRQEIKNEKMLRNNNQ